MVGEISRQSSFNQQPGVTGLLEQEGRTGSASTSAAPVAPSGTAESSYIVGKRPSPELQKVIKDWIDKKDNVSEAALNISTEKKELVSIDVEKTLDAFVRNSAEKENKRKLEGTPVDSAEFSKDEQEKFLRNEYTLAAALDHLSDDDVVKFVDEVLMVVNEPNENTSSSPIDKIRNSIQEILTTTDPKERKKMFPGLLKKMDVYSEELTKQIKSCEAEIEGLPEASVDDADMNDNPQPSTASKRKALLRDLIAGFKEKQADLEKMTCNVNAFMASQPQLEQDKGSA